MKTTVARGVILGLTLAVVLGSQAAWAFYPLGGFRDTGEFRPAKWRLDFLDVNHDGDVDVDTEGVRLTFESGEKGFDDTEIALALEGFNVWERVPTTYIAYSFKDKTPDLLEAEEGAGSVDGINYVTFEFSEDDTDYLPDDDGAAAAVTYTLEDVTVTIDGVQVVFSGDQMVEVDFILNGDVFNDLPDDDIEGLIGLRAACVWVAGFGLGLGPSPLTNFSEEILDDGGDLIAGLEDRVVYLFDQFGQPQFVGVTSSMIRLNFGYTDGEQSRTDLAPDDIAGVSYLYPRSDQSNFYTLSQEARTVARVGLPSSHLEGAHIVAWCDADNNPSTNRVPFVDTLTGLYETVDLQQGQFDLRGLFKQLPLSNGNLFEPTYAITCSPFELEWDDPSEFNTTRQFGNGGGSDLEFADLFSSEVFREGGNILSDDNVEEGTPLTFSVARNRIISAESGKSLEQMLPAGTPMFGQRNKICPYNVVVSSLGVMPGAKALRSFRDSVLLSTAAGTAVVDVYYQIAPSIAGFLLDYPFAYRLARGFVLALDWAIGNWGLLLILGLLLVARHAFAVLRTRRVRAFAAVALLVGVLFAAGPANAQSPPISTEKLVEKADQIVTGEVTAVEGRWTPERRIVTDVTLKVTDVLKGGLEKESEVKIQVLGGQVGPLVTYVTSMPRFKEGEEAVVFLKARRAKKAGEPDYLVAQGYKGKFTIRTDGGGAGKYVAKSLPSAPPEPLFGEAPKKAAGETDPNAAHEKRVPLEAYKAQIRQVVLDQAGKK